MEQNFEKCLAIVLHHEGGWTDHPSDPGGATMNGITLSTLRRWWAETGKTGIPSKDELRAIEPNIVARIYREHYWLAIGCDTLPVAVDLLAFDGAVNQGVGRAAKILQQTAGAVVDGAIGPNTLRAVRAKFTEDPRGFLAEFAARRMRHYGGLSTFNVFGLGWSRRLMDIVTRATEMKE